MDLGAPILDVTDSSSNKSIVKDGVVTAPGFKAKVLTATATN